MGLLACLFDESEFLSPHGLRALSAYHRQHPCEIDVEGVRGTIDYEPAESTTSMFGGNARARVPLCGSADLCAGTRRRPTASVNLIAVHDGFTLRDNRSWNCGAEGPTGDAGIQAPRARQSRAMLTTLLLSFGVPLLLGGDEIGRTQLGNNNAYCQDNELTWFDWARADHELLDFTRRVIALRKAHPVFRRRRFLAGTEAADLRWFTPRSGRPQP